MSWPVRTNIRNLLVALALLSVALLSHIDTASAAGEKGELSLSTGMDFSTGDYGETTDTDIWYVPFTAKYETDRTILKFTVPYLRLTGPGVILGDTVVGASNDQRRTESGVGDIITSAFFNLLSGSGRVPLTDLGVKVKFGTADEDKGLGTGEEDVSLQLDLAERVGQFSLFGTVGYKWRGDPDGFELENGAYLSVGGGRRFRPKTSGGLILDIKESGSRGQENVVELTAYIGWKVRKEISLLGYAVVGFSDTSPDGGIGFQVNYRP